MTLCASTVNFLTQESPVRIRDYLIEEVASEEQGREAMTWLRAYRPAVCNEALCLFYDVAVYRTGDTCFKDSAPADELDKWFVATASGSDLDDSDQRIPLADTEEQAFALAVQHLELDSLFHRVPECSEA